MEDGGLADSITYKTGPTAQQVDWGLEHTPYASTSA